MQNNRPSLPSTKRPEDSIRFQISLNLHLLLPNAGDHQVIPRNAKGGQGQHHGGQECNAAPGQNGQQRMQLKMNGQQASGVSTQCKEDGVCNAHQTAKANDEVEARTQGNVDAYQNRQ